MVIPLSSKTFKVSPFFPALSTFIPAYKWALILIFANGVSSRAMIRVFFVASFVKIDRKCFPMEPHLLSSSASFLNRKIFTRSFITSVSPSTELLLPPAEESAADALVFGGADGKFPTESGFGGGALDPAGFEKSDTVAAGTGLGAAMAVLEARLKRLEVGTLGVFLAWPGFAGNVKPGAGVVAVMLWRCFKYSCIPDAHEAVGCCCDWRLIHAANDALTSPILCSSEAPAPPAVAVAAAEDSAPEEGVAVSELLMPLNAFAAFDAGANGFALFAGGGAEPARRERTTIFFRLRMTSSLALFHEPASSPSPDSWRSYSSLLKPPSSLPRRGIANAVSTNVHVYQSFEWSSQRSDCLQNQEPSHGRVRTRRA